MPEKYILYIDILGFSNLVRNDHTRIPELFEVVDQLNVHRHHAFTTIGFSDTLVAFNTYSAESERDHRYTVMYACEFAQDLHYRLVGRGIYFRGYLTYGDFFYSELENINAYFGQALIDAYRRQDAINCLGLFIDERCMAHNSYFPTIRHDNASHFTFISSSTETLRAHHQSTLPVPLHVLENTDELWRIAWDVRFLKEIHALKDQHPEPKVRAKHLAAWNYHLQRYPDILHELEASEFDLHTINPEFDWTRWVQRIGEE